MNNLSVVAVIASFEPAGDLLEVLDHVSAQVDSVVIVDDGSPSLATDPTGAVAGVLDRCAAAGATVLHTSENRGIAHALNQGVRVALERGAAAVLTLDQDTHLEPDYIERVGDHLDLASSVGIRRVLASPSRINEDVAPFWFAERGLTLAFEPIQSGLVITREVFDEVGLFDEGLFIDCVETEFYLRARARGAHALVVPGTGIRHRLGRRARWVPPRPLRWLIRGGGAGIEFSEDAPFRHYYIARNRIVLYRKYFRTEPLWCAVSIAKDTISRGRAILIGTQRRSRIYLTTAGLAAGLRGDVGRIPERTRRRAEGISSVQS
ncbi:glycosyltransferase [Gordonia sp. ABSL1-1]|uniref:glycosyltransferase n=1 Tax=Gordonia sp. ABSL1-1 TaxID=3053923 RepID=UPI00257444F7|nr:glycosyltransferase [Gordonia sp. ABSL1-1]MDL9936855.1 glycosyltransferase [Gordonia sp. ABSL1-1]